MIEARLVIEATAEQREQLEAMIAAGCGHFRVVAVEAFTEGELVRHDLRPRLIEAASLVVVGASADEADGRPGPAIRVYATRPEERTDR